MKRILGLGLLLALFSLPLLAAKNSAVFVLAFDVRVGDIQLPQGHWNVTWTETSGSQVQLTIKAGDKKRETKTITIPAQVIQGKQSNATVGTVVLNGVRYLKEIQTKEARFIIQDAPNDVK
jgi:phenolic acid decarboxylase